MPKHLPVPPVAAGGLPPATLGPHPGVGPPRAVFEAKAMPRSALPESHGAADVHQRLDSLFAASPASQRPAINVFLITQRDPARLPASASERTTHTSDQTLSSQVSASHHSTSRDPHWAESEAVRNWRSSRDSGHGPSHRWSHAPPVTPKLAGPLAMTGQGSRSSNGRSPSDGQWRRGTSSAPADIKQH